MNPLDILTAAPRRAARTPLTVRVLAWLGITTSPAPKPQRATLGAWEALR